MDCLLCRESLSARIDGETEPAPADRVDEHLRNCAACHEWHRSAAELSRTLRVRPATPVPDLTAAILADAPDITPQGWWARGALLAVSAGQLALGLGQVVGLGESTHTSGGGPMMTGHLFNESTAWNIALGFAMFWAAFRPRATSGLIPLLAAFVVVLFAYSTHDLVTGAAPIARVATHGLLVAGLCLMIVVNRQHRTPTPGGADRAGTTGAVAGNGQSSMEQAGEAPGTERPHLRPAGRHRAA